ncbi:MAG: Acyltransferase 3 [Verrucomicrobiaceae bacterium]|nr:Acyltransferase 3 [Verrucomicrobiaceae bacterium]
MNSAIKHDIAFLDFLRGWSAIFVFFHHASILGGGPFILAGPLGQEAVNAFMLASGFLIYFQCSTSKAYDGLRSSVGIKNFFIRRFFRIAPAYYLALIVALVLSHYLGECRLIIQQTSVHALSHQSTEMIRYYIPNYFENFLLHITFIFGLLPSFAFSTPLPDWSLGLEMQFYVFFPVLFFFLKKNFLNFLTLTMLAMLALGIASTRLGLNYPMPSFLPLKFHNFAAGIALAYLLINKEAKVRYLIAAVAVVFLLLGNRSIYMPALFLFSWWFLCVDHASTHRLKEALNTVFKHRSSKFLADISYSVYIFHLILVLPFFAFVLNGHPLSLLRWTGFSLILLMIVSAVGFVIYKYVELPGIKLGKSLLVSAKPTTVVKERTVRAAD